MAIGDAVAVFLGTAITNRQPASGVEEQLSMFSRNGTTDNLFSYDGSNLLVVFNAAAEGGREDANANAKTGIFNIAFMITNAIYARKTGTTNLVYIGGVQTNA